MNAPTPSQLAVGNWQMPPEWAPHTATWLSWPRNRDTWRSHLGEAQCEFVGLVRAIAEDEPVKVLVGRPDEWAAAEQALGRIARVELIDIPTNDAWARDYAPTFVVSDRVGEATTGGTADGGAAPASTSSAALAAVDWHYNAWGGKYPPYDEDQQVARRIAEVLGCVHRPIELCLEGGAIEIDARGTLLCTRTCALDPRRNPGRSEAEITELLCAATGAQRVVWLTGDALLGDDTDGHIDQLARFTPQGAVLYAWTENRSDPQYAGLLQNRADLAEGLAAANLEDRLIALPLPDPVRVDGAILPACYCNFYLTNGSVLVPQFDRPQDATACAILADQFPERRVVGVASTALTIGLGSLHCLTQQQPQVPGASPP